MDILTPDNRDPLSKGMAQMASGAHQTIDKVSQAARPAVERATSGAHQAVDRAEVVAKQAADALGAQADHLKQAQAHLTEACGNYMRSYPMASLGVAVGVGYMLSRMFNTK